jgi:hypothetical protein
MMKRRLSLVLVALFLGYIFEARFAEKQLGVAFPFFIFFCLVLWFVVLLVCKTDLLPSNKSFWLFVPPIWFAMTATLNAQNTQSLKYALSLVFLFLYLGLLSMTYLGGRLEHYSFFDYLQNFYRLIRTLLLEPLQFVLEIVQDRVSANQDRPVEVVRSAWYGNCISVLIFAALFGLFWWVDLIFRQFHIDVINLIFPPGEDKVHLFHIIIWGYLILGVFLYSARRSEDKHLSVDDEPVFFRRWFTLGRSFQIFVAPMFPLITFTVLHIFYFINPLGFSDSYLKDGFPSLMEPNAFWAFTVASALIFLLVGWLNHVTVFNGKRDRLVHTILNCILFILVSFLVGAAIMCVSIYTIGIHADRQVWYARGGVGWLWLMFGMFVYHEFRNRERNYPYAALRVTTVLIGAYCFLGAIVPTP